MNHCDLNHTDVESLALERSFSDLTPEERTAVLRLVGSADAYTGLRAMLLAVRSELSADRPELEPRAATRERLLLAMEERGKRRGPVPLLDTCLAMVSRRVPAYYSAAAVVAAVAATLLLARPEPQREVVREVVYVQPPAPAAGPQVDTAPDPTPVVQRPIDLPTPAVRVQVQHERPVQHERSVQHSTAVIRDTALRNVADMMKTVAERYPGYPHNVFVGLGNLPHLDAQPRGRTLAEDTSLSKFIRTISISKDTL